MQRIDVFNGDADGICALHQLRLAEPAETVLVTGPKRDIALVERVAAQPGDEVTVEGIYRALGELSDPGGVRAVLRLADKPYGSAVRSRALAALRRLSEPAR